MPSSAQNQDDSTKKRSDEDWIKVPKDPEWQEDIDEHDQIYSGPGAETKKPSELKSTSFGSLLKEFCLKIMDTSSRSSGMTRRVGESRAGPSAKK